MNKSCNHCKHYRSGFSTNECLFTGDYCFRTIENCEYFEEVILFTPDEMERNK